MRSGLAVAWSFLRRGARTNPHSVVRMVSDGSHPTDRATPRTQCSAARHHRTGRERGLDRPDPALPGRQDEMVRAVAAANPRTVVVVNAGAPVLMPWADDVRGGTPGARPAPAAPPPASPTSEPRPPA